MNRTSFIRKRNLPTPPPSSLSDINDSSSCSSTSSSSYSTTTQCDNNNTVTSCDILNILTDARFRPVFQAIDEIKRRKCRPDLERILKYVAKRYTTKNLSDQRNEILAILDELLKYGLITKVFHKGGFTIRIKNEKYAKLIENMNICYNQKTPTATPMSPHEAMAVALVEQQRSISKQTPTETNNHKRDTPSPEFDVFKTGKC
jgi:ArsR family metal-binding transcriptional regulator